MPPCVVGVDLGGTNVRAQALYADGTVAGPRVETASHAQSGPDRTMDQVALAVEEAASAADQTPICVGLAVAGHVDDEAGMVRWSPNLGQEIDGVFYYWKDVPVRALLANRMDRRVVLVNDANAAALGEYMFGSGKGTASCLALFTMGTGIGSGVVLGSPAVQGGSSRPLLLLGGNKGGVELGHMVVQRGGQSSNAGAYGSLEGYCQRDAISARAVYRLLRGSPSCLTELCGGDLSLVDPRMLAQAAEAGDALALEVWQETGGYLGVAVGNVINAFSPAIVAVGGQVAKAHRFFLDAAVREARNTAIPSLFADAKIIPAEHIDDAGLLGAAAVASQSV